MMVVMCPCVLGNGLLSLSHHFTEFLEQLSKASLSSLFKGEKIKSRRGEVTCFTCGIVSEQLGFTLFSGNTHCDVRVLKCGLKEGPRGSSSASVCLRERGQ